MRVVVFGATGNVGTAVLRALERDETVVDIVGVARRIPSVTMPKVRWERADITCDPLDHLVAGADVVVHLAWAIQPSHDEALLRRTNVMGSARVAAAVVRNDVPALVYASSVGTYATAPVGTVVDETWPHSGIESSQYSRDKAAVELILDRVEADHPELRVVRLRKALVFQRSAASEIKRLFLGPFAPIRALGRRGVPVVPADARLAFQVVHADDAGEAYRLAIVGDARGAFNIATAPVVDPELLARTMGGRTVEALRPRVLRFGAAVAHRLRLQPTEPGWIDLATGAPLMSTAAASARLGWTPQRSSTETLRDLLDGFAHGAGTDTPPLGPVWWGRRVPLERRRRGRRS